MTNQEKLLEHARQVAIEFAEWIRDNYEGVLYKHENRWCTHTHANYGSANESDYMTTEQLYIKYKKEV